MTINKSVFVKVTMLGLKELHVSSMLLQITKHICNKICKLGACSFQLFFNSKYAAKFTVYANQNDTSSILSWQYSIFNEISWVASTMLLESLINFNLIHQQQESTNLLIDWKIINKIVENCTSFQC